MQTYIFYKDLKRRICFSKQEYIRYKLKFYFNRVELCTYLKYELYFKFFNLTNNSSLIFSNRCIFSNRSKGLIHFVKLSRLYFKLYIGLGHLRGIFRSRH